MNKTIWIIVCTLSILCMPANATKYTITYKGIAAGEADFAVTQSEGTYQAKLVLHPVLLAKLSGIDELIESSVGKFRDGYFYPSAYRRENKAGHTMMFASFSPQSVKVVKGNATKQIEIAPLGKDPLSQIAQIQHDLSYGNLQENYYLVTDDNQRQYRATQIGKKIILTEFPSKNRQFVFVFDSNNQLIRMQKNKKGKAQFTAQKIK